MRLFCRQHVGRASYQRLNNISRGWKMAWDRHNAYSMSPHDTIQLEPLPELGHAYNVLNGFSHAKQLTALF